MIKRFMDYSGTAGERAAMGMAVLRMATLILGLVFLLELVLPVHMSDTPADREGLWRSPGRDTLAISSRPANFEISRRGLFRPSIPLADKPMAEGTIEKIKSQLKVQCIMAMNKEPVAYVNINGVGLRQCKVGETIQELFTVVAIHRTSVEITILGHKVILDL